jgi:uncharacterized protein (TIGR02147 family)
MQTPYPDIYAYIDHRKFLHDFYVAKRSGDRTFTHTFIARQLGRHNARGFFSAVINGRISLSIADTARLATLLELNAAEKKFFGALVAYNQTENPEDKMQRFEQLLRCNKGSTPGVDRGMRAFYRDWHHSAIRALLDIVDVRDDFSALGAVLLPPMPVAKVRSSIRLLNRLGLIRPDRHGFWKPTEKVVTGGNQVENVLIRQFQTRCLDQARNALMDDTVSEKLNIAMTICLSENARQLLYERIRHFKGELRSIISKDDAPSSCVYHLNLNLFPMSSKNTPDTKRRA